MKCLTSRVCVAYDKDGLPVAVADTQRELADMVGITESGLCRALKRNSEQYKWVEIGTMDE